MPSAGFTSGVLQARGGLIPIVCLALNSSQFDAPIHLCNYVEPITRTIAEDEIVFTAAPFDLLLPPETGDAPARARLRVSNISLALMAQLRQLTDILYVRAEIVTLETPDVIEAGPFEYVSAAWVGDAFVIDFDLSPEDILNLPFPGVVITPNNAPGFF